MRGSPCARIRAEPRCGRRCGPLLDLGLSTAFRRSRLGQPPRPILESSKPRSLDMCGGGYCANSAFRCHHQCFDVVRDRIAAASEAGSSNGRTALAAGRVPGRRDHRSQKMPVGPAILTSALVFGLLHGIALHSGASGWLQLGYRIGLGILGAYLAVRYRSLRPSFVLHATNNCVVVIASGFL